MSEDLDKAGPALDAWIAEHVMGWRRIGKNMHTKPAHRPSRDFPGQIINDWGDKGPHDFLVPGNCDSVRVAFCGCESTTTIPNYFSDIYPAMEVVEKLKLRVPSLTIVHNSMLKDTKQWTIWDHEYGPEEDADPLATDDSLTLAICLAAKKEWEAK